MSTRHLIWPLAAALMPACAPIEVPPYNATAERQAQSYELTRRGWTEQSAGRLDNAEDLYRQAVQLDPNSYAAWMNMGTILLERGHYQDAAGAFKAASAVCVDPNDPRPYENLGLVYYTAGRDEQALRYYELALGRNESWVPALRGTALAARRLNRADEKLAAAMRQALMVETDAKWREIFDRERGRIEDQLRLEEKERREVR